MLTHCLHCKAWDPLLDGSDGFCRRLAPLFLVGEVLDQEDRAAEARRERQRSGLDVAYLDRAVWPRTSPDDGCCDGFPKDEDECQPLPDAIVVPRAKTAAEVVVEVKREQLYDMAQRHNGRCREKEKPDRKKPGPKCGATRKPQSVASRIETVLRDGPKTSAELAGILGVKQTNVGAALSANPHRFQKAEGHHWKLAEEQ